MNSPIKESRRALQGVLRSLRSCTPHTSFSHVSAASSDIRTGYWGGRPVRRLVVTLRAPGCAWVERSGGCVMCGHYAGTMHGVIPAVADTVTQFTREIARYNLSDFEVLSLYNSGSALNPDELPDEALDRIFSVVRNLPTVKKVVVESRPEYVNSGRIDELRDILGRNKRLSIAMGLETVDDEKRDLCINKGCSRKTFETVIDSVKGIADIQLYVLLGIPFLTEAEMIDDAIETLRYAHSLGVDEIHIEPATLQRYSLLDIIAQSGLYRLPSLYSLYEVLRAVVPGIRPYVSPFLHMPLPAMIPEGCPLCTETLVYNLLNRYNIHRDRASLDYESCRCIPEWRQRLAVIDTRPLHERVRDVLERLSCEATP